MFQALSWALYSWLQLSLPATLRTVTPTFQMKTLRLSKKQGFAQGPRGRRGHISIALSMYPVLVILGPFHLASWRREGASLLACGSPFSPCEFPLPLCGSLASHFPALLSGLEHLASVGRGR